MFCYVHIIKGFDQKNSQIQGSTPKKVSSSARPFLNLTFSILNLYQWILSTNSYNWRYLHFLQYFKFLLDGLLMHKYVGTGYIGMYILWVTTRYWVLNSNAAVFFSTFFLYKVLSWALEYKVSWIGLCYYLSYSIFL